MVMHLAGRFIRRAGPPWVLSGFVGILFFIVLCSGRAAEYSDAREQYVKGQYDTAFKACQQAIADQEYGEDWRLLQAKLATMLLTGSTPCSGRPALVMNGRTTR